MWPCQRDLRRVPDPLAADHQDHRAGQHVRVVPLGGRRSPDPPPGPPAAAPAHPGDVLDALRRAVHQRPGRWQGGLSPRTVRAIHVTAHKALKEAVKDNLIAPNPTDDANVPAQVRSQTQSWTAEEATAFLGSVRSNRLSAAFVTLATSGLRRSELLGLRWADIDLEAGTLAVRQVISLDKYTPFISEPKTAKSRRVVALDAGTVAALRSHRIRQLEERVAAGPACQQFDLVFAREDGSILHPQTLSGTFERAAKAAGLPAIGIHGLRHSHASIGLAAGVPLVIMSERLGHSSVAMTGDVYSHSLPSQHQAAADAIAGLLSPTAEA
jgi:integrase